jgi:thiol-disulfide isomerase/thioredoxin
MSLLVARLVLPAGCSPTLGWCRRGILPPEAESAPALRLADMDGQVFDLAKAHGHWVLVHFWASWCYVAFLHRLVK